MNVIGYFAAEPDCTRYSVKIITNTASTEFEEIKLGVNPFVVTYESSQTPFEPIRTSTASINVVAGDYLMNLYTPGAHGTQVILTKLDDDGEEVSIEWVGYLTTNLLNQPFENCYEEFTMEAIDCLSSLEYFDYETEGNTPSIVGFNSILRIIADKCGLIKNVIITESKKSKSGTKLHIHNFKISERNFFSTDAEPIPWKLSEVLEEMCQYLGYTALQWGTTIYLIDYQYLRDHNDLEVCIMDLTTRPVGTTYTTISNPTKTLSEEDASGTGNNLSLETIYNKIRVLDSFMEVDDFIPDMFEDEMLTSRYGEKWESREIKPRPSDFPSLIGDAYTARYLNKKGKEADEEADTKYAYFGKYYDHQFYESVYRTIDSAATEVTGTSAMFQWDVVDYGIRLTNGVYHLWLYLNIYNPSDEDKEVYGDLYIRQGDGYPAHRGIVAKAHKMTEMRLELDRTDSGISSVVPVYKIQIEGDNQAYGPYPYSAGTENVTRQYCGGTIMDFGSLKKDDTGNWNYEVPNTLQFNKYLCINQASVPYDEKRFTLRGRNWDVRRWSSKDLMTDEIEDHFPEVMRLKSGYKNPIILDSNSYLAIDCAAIYERYFKRDYINPDWVKENTGIGGVKSVGIGISETGLIKEVTLDSDYNAININSVIGNLNHPEKWEFIITDVPILHFKLGIGNYYWNGEGWYEGERAFRVKLSTPTDSNGKINMEEWWNDEHKVLNNISWTEYGGIGGYKISLDDPRLDLSNDIHFAVLLPNKIQQYHGEKWTDGYNWYGDTNHNSYDGYCWIKDFSIKMTTKGAENYELSDVVYENVISDESINELPDITCKFTTYPGNGLLSYSNVGVDGQLLEGISEGSISGAYQKPEENIVEKYYMQYSTPTKVENITIKNNLLPWQKVFDPYFDTSFRVLGQTIDYAANTQQVTLMEIKYGTPETGGTDFIGIDRVDGSGTIPSTGATIQIRILSNRPWTATTASNITIPIPSGTGVSTAITQYVLITENVYAWAKPITIKVTNDKGLTDSITLLQEPANIQLNAPYVNKEECVDCGQCAQFIGDTSIFDNCPTQVGPLEYDSDDKPYIKYLSDCIGCTACLNKWQNIMGICPTDAITKQTL